MGKGHAVARGAAALVAALALGAPGLVGAATTAVTAPAGQVTVPIIANPGSINPIYAVDPYGRAMVSLLYPSLATQAPDGATRPLLAQSWATTDKGRTVTFTLRSGLSWRGGGGVDAADVVATFDAMANVRDGSPYVGVFRAVTTITTRGARRVVVTLVRPDPAFVADVLLLPIAPASVVAPLVAHPRALRANVDLNVDPTRTAGPFWFVRWVRDTDTWTFAANSGDPWGAPRIASLVVQYYATSADAWQAFRQGQVDVADVPSSAYAQTIAMARAGRLHMQDVPTRQYWYVAFNLRDPIWTDPRVRQAAVEAVDTAAIAKAIGPRPVLPTGGPPPLPPLSGKGGQLGGLGYDPLNANRLLQDAGWVMAANGVRYRKGRPLVLTLETVTGVGAWQRTIEAVVADLREVGFEVTVDTVTFHDLSNQLPLRTHGPLPGAYALAWDMLAGSNALTLFGGRDALPPWGQDVGGYGDATVTAAMASLAAGGLSARKMHTVEGLLAKALYADPPGIFLFRPVGAVAWTNRLHLPSVAAASSSVLAWPQLWSIRPRQG